MVRGLRGGESDLIHGMQKPVEARELLLVLRVESLGARFDVFQESLAGIELRLSR